MKKILLFANLLFFVNAYSQTKTITLKPDSTHGKDAVVFSRTDAKAKNYGNVFHNSAATWTWDNDGLGQGTFRSLIEFGLDTLPKGTIIKSATLKMYYTKAVKIDGNHQTPNPSTLYRITQGWGENTVTWNNQPPIAATGISISGLSGTSNLEVDVTTDVQDMFANGSSNFGWLLKNNSENPYVGILLASSDNSDYAKNPELILDVILPPTKITLKPDSTNGKDAVVFSRADAKNNNYGKAYHNSASTWTWDNDGLGQGTFRTLIEFNLDTLPKGFNIKSAKLKMYYTKAVKTTDGHESPNPSTLYRLTQGWTESSVTWNSQPPVATTGISIPVVATGTSNIEIDVTRDVKDMYANGAANFGWLLKNNTESPYVGLYFASSDNKDYTKNPELIIEFGPDDVTEILTHEVTTTHTVFPNPSVSGVFEFTQETSGVVYSINGVEVAKIKNATKVDLSNQVKGIYIIKTENGNVFKVISK